MGRSLGPKFTPSENTMRALIIATALALLFATTASAQTSSDSTFTPPKQDKKAFCPMEGLINAFHPSEPVRTVFCYYVEPDGKVKDLMILQTSENKNIDRMWADCISTFIYTPATRDGKPIEFPMPLFLKMCARQSTCNKEPDPNPADLQDACEKALIASGHPPAQ